MMNIKTILAVIFALLIGIGGTTAYFYFDRLDHALNAPPVPPVSAEQGDKVIPPAPPANNAAVQNNSQPKVESVPVKSVGALKNEDLVMGGISVGASIDAVRSVHGEPYEIETKNKWHGNVPATVYEYRSLFDLYVSDGIVRAIKVEKLNGLVTSKNIRVGSTEKDVLAAYGDPNLREKHHWTYFVENNPNMGIEFEFETGFVDEIRVGLLR